MSRNALPLLHPLTGAPIVPLGHRKNGQPIWPILGGSEPTGDQGGQPTGTADQGAPAGGAPAGQPSDQQGGQNGSWDGKVESLPEPVQKMIRELRKEAGDNRVGKTQAEQAAEQRQQDMLRAIAKAAGYELPGDEQGKPDANALTQQLSAAQTAQRQAAVELAVYRNASKHAGDPDSLLDSRAFLKAVDALDPASDTFGADVDAAIKAAVDSNPKLKAGRAPGTSGTDHTGGSGEQRTRTPRPLTEAVAGHYGTA